MDQPAPQTPIPVPRNFFEPTIRGMWKMILRALALWLLPIAGILTLVFATNLPLWLQVLSITVLTLLSAHGLQCVGLIGHDGTHFNLHPDKLKSAYIGVGVSSLVPFHFDTGFAVHHADHHRFTNTEKDPDAILFGQYQNFWSRLFLARFAASQRYLNTTLKLAFNRWPAEQKISVGLSLAELKNLARFNLVISTLLVIFYAWVLVSFPLAGLLAIVLPTFATVLVSGLRPYVEHSETRAEKLSQARSWISPAFDFLYGGINYHLAHHLFPSVPASKAREFHDWMVAHGRIPADDIKIHSWQGFFQVAAKPMIDFKRKVS